MLARDIEFFYEIGTLRNLERSWKQVLGLSCASVLEHTIRVVFLALLLARLEGETDEEKVIKMALVHDLAEARTGDANAVHSAYAEKDEERAAGDLFSRTHFTDLNDSLFKEYEERMTRAARIVKDADHLDVDLELKELAERGSQVPKKWNATRRAVRRKKLYTASARKLFDEIQGSDPVSWYLATMKRWKLNGEKR